MSLRVQVAIALVFVATPAPAKASYFWNNALSILGFALYNYQRVYGSLPKDFELTSQKMSWRVAILPFIDQDSLYQQILKGKEIPQNAPAIFTNLGTDPRRTAVVALRGKGTAWTMGIKNIKRDPGRAVLLVGVAQSEAPIWHEPWDLDYNPAQPRNGLGWSRVSCFPNDRVCFAVFADERVGMIRESVDDDFLRALFTADREPPRDGLDWYGTMSETRLGPVIAGAFLFGVFAVAGIGLNIYRLVKRQTVSAGELLWLILGAHQLVFLAIFTSIYEYHHVLGYHEKSLEREFWFYPELAASLTAGFALIRFWRVPGWRGYFIALVVLLALDTLDAGAPMPYPRRAEESLVTSVPTMVCFLGGIGAAVLTCKIGIPGEKPRRWAHWCGIVLMLLPVIWYCIWSAEGGIQPRHWFSRVRE